jgi:protein-tyrosine-phosphatase
VCVCASALASKLATSPLAQETRRARAPSAGAQASGLDRPTQAVAARNI